MFVLGNIPQPLEAFFGESGRQSGELMTYAQVGEAFTDSTAVGNILRLVGLGWLGGSEALDRQVGPLVHVDDPLGISLDVVEDARYQFVG